MTFVHAPSPAPASRLKVPWEAAEKWVFNEAEPMMAAIITH